jgi:hypothetical protein
MIVIDFRAFIVYSLFKTAVPNNETKRALMALSQAVLRRWLSLANMLSNDMVNQRAVDP